MLIKREVLRQWLMVLLFLFLAGCAGLGRPVQDVQVTLVDMQVLDVKPLEAVFQIALRVMNPNDFSLLVNGINCDLKIDGKHFATGVGETHREIPSFGTGILPVTVYASTLKMFSSTLAIIKGMEQQQKTAEPLRYELAGNIRLGGTLRRTVPFQSRGEFSFDGQPGEE